MYLLTNTKLILNTIYGNILIPHYGLCIDVYIEKGRNLMKLYLDIPTRGLYSGVYAYVYMCVYIYIYIYIYI